MVDHSVIVEMATRVTDQIVDDLNMMSMVHRHWSQLTAEERDELAEGWIALITEEFQ